jgi:hypothetical protein
MSATRAQRAAVHAITILQQQHTYPARPARHGSTTELTFGRSVRNFLVRQILLLSPARPSTGNTVGSVRQQTLGAGDTP